MKDGKAIVCAAALTLAAAMAGAGLGEGLSRVAGHPAPGEGLAASARVGMHEETGKAEPGEASPVAAVAAEPAAVAPTTAPDNTEALARGKKLYATACIACHAADGTGVSPIGSNLTLSEMVKSKDTKSIVELIKAGRSKDDPKNRSGYPMPAKGMNPMMRDKQIDDLAAYVATLGATQK